MAELAALLTPGAVIEPLPARIPIASHAGTFVPSPRAAPRMRPPRSAKCVTAEPAKAAQNAETHAASPETSEGVGTRTDATSQLLDDVTLAAARSARFYRSWMFENLMAGFGVALDQAADMVGKPSAAKTSAEPAAPKADSGPLQAEAWRVPPNEAADDYRGRLLQLTNATINANLDYARKLAAVRSPAEFAELSTGQVCAQGKLCVKHAVALARLSRSFTAMGWPKR
jgi:Phasin protein